MHQLKLLNNKKIFMEEKGKKNRKKTKLPKFNFYWIYGIVAIILISINLFNPSNTGLVKINELKFQEFVEKEYVKEVIIINKEEARVTLYPEKLAETEHGNDLQKNVFGGDNLGPHYYFNIGETKTSLNIF